MSEQDRIRVRASDAEREQVVSTLRDAMGEGRLTLAEGEERIAGVYAATYRDELPAFTADLPQPEPPRPGRASRGPTAAGRRRRAGSPAPLVALLAVAAGIWALAGGPIWPAIVLGILTIMAAKGGGACRQVHSRHWRAEPEPADRV
jgi:Domain of unknown function (DUF1707)